MQRGTLSFDDRFSQLAQIGSGSMGTVYKAWDQETQTHVALKLLHNNATSARFEREGRVLSQIAHANIVRYVGHGVTPAGQPWLAMEWLEGCDLDSYLKPGVLEPEDTLRVARALSSGLSWAHDRGFIHRDLKPSNVFIPPAGLEHAKIVDFGLARDVVQEDALTKTGMLIGTLEYMPPEQVSDAKRADQRADVFSLGAVLYRCLTGMPPARGNTLPEILMNIMRGTIPPITSFRKDVPEPFAKLIASMLEKNADLRPANATHIALALDAIDRRARPVLDLDAETEMMSTRPSYMPPPAPPPRASAPAPRSSAPGSRPYAPGSRRPTPLPRPPAAARSGPHPAAPLNPLPKPNPPPNPPSSPAFRPNFPPKPAGPAAMVPARPRPPLLHFWPYALLALGVLALTLSLCR